VTIAGSWGREPEGESVPAAERGRKPAAFSWALPLLRRWILLTTSRRIRIATINPATRYWMLLLT
jgi:hypothetical protein